VPAQLILKTIAQNIADRRPTGGRAVIPAYAGMTARLIAVKSIVTSHLKEYFH
jgi:hypothetical protein